MERAVSFTKGCYVGQEPVARMFHKGHPNRHLRGLALAAPVEPGAPVAGAASKEVGRVDLRGRLPALGPIALAIVRREVEPGDEVSVGRRDRARRSSTCRSLSPPTAANRSARISRLWRRARHTQRRAHAAA